MKNERNKRVEDDLFKSIAEDMLKEKAEEELEKVKRRDEKMMKEYDFFISDSRTSVENKLKARIMKEDVRIKNFLFIRVMKASMPCNGVSKSQLRAILTILQELYDKAVDLFEELDF